MKRLVVIALLTAACGGGGGSATPDAAVVTLTCDDPGLVGALRAAVVALPDAAFSDRAALLAAIDAAGAAIAAGPPRTAAMALSGGVLAHIESDVVNESDRVPLRALAQAAAATLAAPTLACPSRVTVACVPPGGKDLDYGVGAADCVDSMPTVSCAPASGTKVMPGDSTGSCTATASDGAQASCGFEIHAVPEGQPAITGCPASPVVACTGEVTAVDLGAAVVDGCGETPTVTDNAPPGGYFVGTTAVQVTATTASGSDTCLVDVTVTDDVAPTITCPAATTVVRTDPAVVAMPPAPTVADNCDDRGIYGTTPIDLPRGVTTVTYDTIDVAGNVASCTTDVTVLEAFAPTGLRIASAALAGDGTTSVVLAWDRSFGADATGYRVERAAAPGGPFTPLASVSVGTQTLGDVLPPTGAYYRVVTLAGTFDGGAVGPVRAHAIAAAGYDLRDQSVPTVAFPTTLYGVVRHPVDLAGGPYPLVVLIHGNHGICRPSPTSDDNCATSNSGDCPFGGQATTPNAEGMVFQAETLAAHGYVAVTISANALNCRNDYILERSQLVVEHLRRWQGWSTAGGAPFGATFVGAVDMTRVGLVGHSRGGEAVAHVPAALAATPVAGVGVGAVFSIAPTDYHTPTPAGAPYAVLLPACDGDVANLSGMHIYDRALDPADPSERVQVLFTGANHNFFSTEWKFDDNGDGYICDTSDEVGGVAQRAMLAPTEAAWFDATIPPPGTVGGLEPFLRAEGGTPLAFSALAGADLDLRWAYSAPARAQIDDFSGANAPDVNLLGQPNAFTGFTSARSCNGNGCDANFEHTRDALLLNWSAASAKGTLGLGNVDASGFAVLSFRIVSRESALNDAFAPQDLVIRVVDGAGHTAELLLSDVQRVPYLYPTNFPREILQTVRVPLADLAAMNPDLVLGDLATLELEASAAGHASGAVIISDVEFAE